ncbi:RecB family exonuclease [Micromonospora sp. 4G55]|uniref:RecB family exonuclease n=1 Tax=Micromonospora sp. 4G55 TaxID=2806102 RepID=UPI0035C6E47A
MGAQLARRSVHTALKNWYALTPERRRPEALAGLLKGTWVREGYRDDEQERQAYRRALGWLEAYVETLEPGADPLGVERVVAVRTAVLAFNGRADRIDSRPGPDGPELVIVDYKTGRTGLDTDDARGSQALALYAYAAERTFRRPCRRVELHHLPTGTVAAHDHTTESLTRQLTRAEDTARDIMAAERAVADGADPDEAFPPVAVRAAAGATTAAAARWGRRCPAVSRGRRWTARPHPAPTPPQSRAARAEGGKAWPPAARCRRGRW